MTEEQRQRKRKRDRRYYLAHREELLAKMRARNNSPEGREKHRKYTEEHRERINELARKRLAANEEYRKRKVEMNREWKLRKKATMTDEEKALQRAYNAKLQRARLHRIGANKTYSAKYRCEDPLYEYQQAVDSVRSKIKQWYNEI